MYNNGEEEEQNIRQEYGDILTNYLETYQYLLGTISNFMIMTLEDQKMLLTDIINYNSEMEGLLRDINNDEVCGDGLKFAQRESSPSRRRKERDEGIGDEYY